MTEEQLISKIAIFLGVARQATNSAFDAMISLKEHPEICAYAIFKTNVPDDNSLSKWIKLSGARITEGKNLRKLPVVLFYSKEECIKFGIFVDWDFDNCYINDQINWRVLNDANIPWLKLQLSLRRNVIKMLPENMFRVVKTIYLNSDEVTEGSIKYLRKFNPSTSYIMQKPTEHSQEDRFNRLLHGTPENEYPIDNLDKIILQQIIKSYPRAQMRSSLLLFDSDLINLRVLKERKIYPLSLYFIPVTYNELGIPTNDPQKNMELKMELYYVPNFFTETQISPINQVMQLDDIADDLLNAIRNTYQPLSFVNI